MHDKVLLVIYRILLAMCIVALIFAYRDPILRKIRAIGNPDVSEEAANSYENGDNAGLESSLFGDGTTDGSLLNGNPASNPESFGSNSAAYSDERKPDYKLVNSYVNNPVSNEFTWTSFEGLYYATICYSIDSELYEYYKSLSRYYGNDEYINYINDPLNSEYLDMIVENLEEIGDRREYTPGERVREAVSFCQSFEYETDDTTSAHTEWPKYPVELLYERKGDCEDTSLLLAGILTKMGYGVALIKFDDHMAVGIKGDDTLTGTYFTYEGNDYYYVETTNKGWYIGEIPEEYTELPASVIVIN